MHWPSSGGFANESSIFLGAVDASLGKSVGSPGASIAVGSPSVCRSVSPRLRLSPRSAGRSLSVASASSPTSPRRCLPAEVEQLVVALEARVGHTAQAEDARIRMLQDHAQQVSEAIEAARVQRRLHEDNNAKASRSLDGILATELRTARNARLDFQNSLGERANQKLHEPLEELVKHKKSCELACTRMKHQLEDEVSRITEFVKDLQATRFERGERIEASVENELQAVHEALMSEREARFEAEATMMQRVEGIMSAVKANLQQERSERELAQEKLLGLLEVTTNRLEVGFSTIQRNMIARNRHPASPVIVDM